MEEVITTLGNFGSSSDYISLVLREMIVLGIIGHNVCSLFREETTDVFLVIVSLRQPWVCH